MGGCSLALTMVLYLTEALYFRSSTLTFYVIFPCVLNCKYFICKFFFLLFFMILYPMFFGYFIRKCELENIALLTSSLPETEERLH